MPLPPELAAFEAAARASRTSGFDWRSAFQRFAAAIPVDDSSARQLSRALVAEIDASARSAFVPAYHNHLHVLDTLSAMELLCASAARLGLALPAPPHVLMLVMLGHDLRHPGGAGEAPGQLERLSADVVATLAGACGMADDVTAQIVSLILATRPDVQIAMRAAGDGALAALLVGEADVMASLLPGLGLDLAASLTAEMAMAGQTVATPFESPVARHAFLRGYQPLSAPAQALGLGVLVAAQLTEPHVTSGQVADRALHSPN